MAYCILNIALDTPLNSCFDYRWPCAAGEEPQVGQLAMVNFGRREVVGLIVEVKQDTEVPADKLKDALAVRGQLAPLSPAWLALAAFAADYYQRPLGEVALPGLPKNLRVLTTVALDRALKKLGKHEQAHDHTPAGVPVLNPAQRQAADASAPPKASRRFCCTASPAAARPKCICRRAPRCWRAKPKGRS
jgi:primosomal protein N' (replication factor Y) (superfamily II helicase)